MNIAFLKRIITKIVKRFGRYRHEWAKDISIFYHLEKVFKVPIPIIDYAERFLVAIYPKFSEIWTTLRIWATIIIV